MFRFYFILIFLKLRCFGFEWVGDACLVPAGQAGLYMPDCLYIAHPLPTGPLPLSLLPRCRLWPTWACGCSSVSTSGFPPLSMTLGGRTTIAMPCWLPLGCLGLLSGATCPTPAVCPWAPRPSLWRNAFDRSSRFLLLLRLPPPLCYRRNIPGLFPALALRPWLPVASILGPGTSVSIVGLSSVSPRTYAVDICYPILPNIG